jgi:hypothetical protein
MEPWQRDRRDENGYITFCVTIQQRILNNKQSFHSSIKNKQ